MNNPVDPGLTTYDVKRGDILRLFIVARGNVRDDDAAIALARMGLGGTHVYAGTLPSDWPAEPARDLANDERAIRATGTWSRDEPMPTAVDATGGSLVLFAVWTVTTGQATAEGDDFGRVVSVRSEFPEIFGLQGVSDAPKRGTDLDDAFYPALAMWGAAHDVPAEWMLLVFYLESRLNPHIGNALGYVGLNQLASRYLRDQFHVDPADYLTWTASQQLEKVVGPWYASTLKTYLGREPRSAGTLYALNIAPARVKSQGDAANAVMYAEGSREYAANSALDRNKDGTITIGDFDQFMGELSQQAPYKAALAELRTKGAVPGGGLVSGDMSTTKAAVTGGVLVGLAALTAWAVRRRLMRARARAA